MERRFLLKPVLAGLLLLALMLTGCTGDDGATGLAGLPGTDGQAGLDGTNGRDGTDGLDGSGLAAKAIRTLAVQDLVFGTDASGFVTASFAVTDGTAAVTGLTTADSIIYLAGLVAGSNGDSDQWQYWAGINDETLVEGPAGTYLLTANKLATDAPAGTTTQRGIVRLAKSGFNTVVNSYDFAIANPAIEVAAGKDVVNDASCKECHGYGVTIHGYGRNDTKTCVVCHSTNYKATMAVNEADMVTMVHQIHSGKAATLGSLHWDGHGENWGVVHNTDPVANVSKYPFKYPGTILNCSKCHNTVAAADNWKSKPTKAGCDSCHNTVTFDGVASVGIKGGAVTHFATADNAMCALCHNAASIAAKHTPAARDDASQRPIVASISGVTVDANGGVTVAFSVQENGVAKTDLTAASFTLAKLVPSTTGTPSYWQSYLSKIRTKDANMAPVIQGRTEAVSDGGTLTNNADGTYTYKFALLNASIPGDIRTIDIARNNSSVAGDYLPANGLTEMRYPVAYEPELTHRVAIGITNNKTNAFFDFVPAGNTAETRNIVSRDACTKCHGDSQLHAGFALEYCVGCHNQNSYDPYSGPKGLGVLAPTDTALAGSSSVELERLIHKIHMGKDLTKGFRVNAAADATSGHIYDGLQFPSGIPSNSREAKASDCKVCHDETNAAMTEADYWQYGSRACGSCHDSDLATAHVNANTDNGFATCTLCHAPGRVAPVKEAHYGE